MENEGESFPEGPSVKKRKIEKTATEKEMKAPLNQTVLDDEEDMKCIICFESWAIKGDHSMTSLPCGHVFGKSCIERWIQSNKICPTCKVKVRKLLLLSMKDSKRSFLVSN